MKLSDNIMWFRKLDFHPAKSQLEQWSEQARGLEHVVATRDDDVNGLAQAIKARDLRLRERDAQIAAQRKSLDNMGAELRLCSDTVSFRDADIKQLKAALTDSELRASPTGTLLKDATAEFERQKNTTRQLEDQNKNLEDQVMTRDSQISCLNAALGHLVGPTNKMERQIHDLIRQRDSLKRCNNDQGDTIDKLVEARNVLQRKLEQITQRNDNQAGFIREYQEEVRKLREQLEAKAGPEQDLYKNSKLEVRLLNDGVVEVLEYDGGGFGNRLRSTKELVDQRTKVARRAIELTRWEPSTGAMCAAVTEYDRWGGTLACYNDVPINGLTFMIG